MSYVNPQDVREHHQDVASVAVPQIAEYMTEIENYVKMRINMDPLPDNVDVLKDIIRELTVAKLIGSRARSPEDLAKADFHRRNGLTMINDVNRDGLFPTTLGSRIVANEVYNPHPEPFFKAEDFAP
jgi:hypothetical protein